MPISPAMVCETAEEVQARLCMFALMPSLQDTNGNAEDSSGPWDGGNVGQASPLHRRARAEIEDVLKSGLQRRLQRLERRIAALDGTPDVGGRQNGAGSEAPRPVHAGISEEASAKLKEICSRALRTAAKAARPRLKRFGPTDLQTTLKPPPEKDEPIIPETATLRVTLDNLQQNLRSRDRQIASLTEQLSECKRIREERVEEAGSLTSQLEALKDSPELLQKAHSDRIRRRRERRAHMEKSLRMLVLQAQHYEKLSQDQRAFFLQSERVAVNGGPEVLARHPCGDIALVPQPLSMANEQPEVWDVGTAVANPYIVDSWPFEPNVLAQRTSQEVPMQPLKEETLEDLVEAERPFSRNPFARGGLDLRLAMPTRDSDEEDGFDNRYGGPTETSRSL